jgi:hypothetical protein
MINLEDSIGKNAGKIWKSLETDRALKKNELIKKTKLKNDDFFAAVGWLARENKIYFNKDMFKLGETNLTHKIGTDAGMVWRVLDTWGEVDVLSISRLARIKESDVYTAVGWLAREGKIGGKKKTKKENKTKFWLR